MRLENNKSNKQLVWGIISLIIGVFIYLPINLTSNSPIILSIAVPILALIGVLLAIFYLVKCETSKGIGYIGLVLNGLFLLKYVVFFLLFVLAAAA